MMVYYTTTDVIIFLIYVDDILVTRSNYNQIQLVITKLNTTFKLQDLGDVGFFLGIVVAKVNDDLHLRKKIC